MQIFFFIHWAGILKSDAVQGYLIEIFEYHWTIHCLIFYFRFPFDLYVFIIIATVLADILFFKAIILILTLGYTFKYARMFSVKLGKQQKHDSSLSALKNQAEKQASRGRLTCLASPRLKCTLRRPAQSRRTGPPRRTTNKGCPFINPRLYFAIKFRKNGA